MDLTMEKLTEGIASAFKAEIVPTMMEALDEKIKEATKPGPRKSLIDEHGEEIVDKALKGAKYFKSIYDHKFSGKALTDDVITATIDDAHVAYGVPTEIMADVGKVEAQESIARLECRTVPQGAIAVNRLLKTAGLTMTHPTEAATGGSTIPTYARRTWTKVKGVMNVPVSNDLFSGGVTPVDMYNEIIRELGIGSGEDLDTYCFNDNTSPYAGILNAAGYSIHLGEAASGITIANVADDALYNKLVDMTTAVSGTSLRGAKFVFHQTILGRIRKIKTTTSLPYPVFEPRMAIDPEWVVGRIFGYPVIASEYLPTYATCSAADIAIGFFGNMQKYLIGQNSDMVIDMSREGTIGTGADVMSAWDLDLTFIRGIVFRSGNLGVPNAFVKLETATS